jgi:hypothetical protein
MDGPHARDRLAVWTYVQHGEEIPCGDPSVTDAERAAAGRETLAERRRAVLPGSRSRAAAQYSAGLPGGEDMVRVWRQRDPAALRARLGETPLVAWAEDDVLHVLWRGTADEVMLGAGVQPRLWPVEGAGDLWEASLRIRRLDEAVISIVALPRRAGGDQPGRMPDQLVWRGPRAAAALPTVPHPAGTLDEHTLHSAALRRPDVFTAVAAFSTGVVPHQIAGRARAARVRHYLAAGTLEAGFRSATRQWAECLQRAGLPCRYREWIGGHDSFWWDQQLPAALAWLLTQP